MPRGNRTGPNGQGPRSGRGLGHCRGSVEPGIAQEAPRLGEGGGRGSRQKRRRRCRERQHEMNSVRSSHHQTDALDNRLHTIETRITELEKETA